VGFFAKLFACGYDVDGYGCGFDQPDPSHTHVEPTQHIMPKLLNYMWKHTFSNSSHASFIDNINPHSPYLVVLLKAPTKLTKKSAVKKIKK